MIDTFTPKRPGEKEVFAFNLKNVMGQGEIIQSVAWTNTIKTYPTPIDAAAIAAAAAMVVGPSSIDGTVVAQTVQGGIDEAYYYLTATVTTNRQVFEAIGIIPVTNEGA